MSGESTGFAQEWLEAATTGGLPEPVRSRWQPLRVGIVDLWEYDEAEFWFADGRMVLRGGNGAGKTKVLELTTLMLMRGEILPSVLDPFGSQHRTMRFNLLPTGEGDDPRPLTDAGLGYAWVEFGRRDETGQQRFFVCGMGASARRGSGTAGVSTWHFVTRHRPGKDFSLTPAGRAIEQKDLKKIDGVTVPGSAMAYRGLLASELFDLSAESYDNLTELLKQLRKPKLGERLNPASLAETLRDALPPPSTHEVTQLAEGWEHLEQLRSAVQETEKAATAVADFVRGGWRPWIRLLLRSRADDFAAATTRLDNTTRDRNTAEKNLAIAKDEVVAVEKNLTDVKREKQDRGTELRELLDSQSYQDAAAAAGRVEGLERDARSLTGQLTRARSKVSREQATVAGAQVRFEKATGDVENAEVAVRTASGVLTEAAGPAGLTGSIERHLPGRDVEALSADLTSRTERFTHLRNLHASYAVTDGEATESGHAVERAMKAVDKAVEEENAERETVEECVETLWRGIRDWADLATVAPCSAELAEEWRDLAHGLTVIDTESGRPQPGLLVTDAMREHITIAQNALKERAFRVRERRAPIANRHQEATAELAAVKVRTESAPMPPTAWQRQERPDGHGAPFWRVVNPVLDGDRLDRLEAALAASGLLDSWLAPDGELSTVDGVLIADVQPLPAGVREDNNLLDVLETSEEAGVSASVVRRLLAGIGWYDKAPTDSAGDWFAADGSWRVGGLTGRAVPAAPASFLGAAAREAARQRQIARLEAELADLAARLSEVDTELAALGSDSDRLAREERAIPLDAERNLTNAVARHADRARRTGTCRVDLSVEQRRHDDLLTKRDRAWGRFAEYASDHGFGLRNLDEQATALREFERGLASLLGRIAVLEAKREALSTAEVTLSQRREELEVAAVEESEVDLQLRDATVRLQTARNALGSDQRQQLQRRDDLDKILAELEKQFETLNDKWNKASVAANKAEVQLDGYEHSRADAERERDGAMDSLWAVVTGGLAEPAGVSPPEKRTVAAVREFTALVRRQITAQAQPEDVERAWRRCYREMEILRQSLLPDRDAKIVEADEVSPIPRVEVLADAASGWQQPHQAADALAGRVREQQDTFDTEQQHVLTTLLESTFIEHLKLRLDYTTHTFARINDQLGRHPTRQGHVVRVQCEADPADPDASAVVTALTRGYQELSADRQDMVRSFLARKIDEAHSDASAEGVVDWKERLSAALDYRHWLKISLQYRPGAGSKWTPFDAAKHAAKSGGEKVVLLSQPLFAAAVAAYDAAGPQAPRWVWLDEAMTGVDAEIKASFMGLTVDFELDVMLTAHDEWCTYLTVPAVAVYDLHRHEALAGVDVQPYLWCGGEWSELAVDQLGASASEPEAPTGGLFDELEDE
ncbi:TIGR02680 family protein [Fodinicola feengrottensis]|uniref:TIGR02680 family protein n=1 Tax=Fodinicola feengrottensis TaxID=435914 RepID=A0ABN2G8G4_9ACTN